jgi:hypothetical protein
LQRDHHNNFGALLSMKRPEQKEAPLCRNCANSHYAAELRGNQQIMEFYIMTPLRIDWHALHEILQLIADIIAIIKGLQR